MDDIRNQPIEQIVRRFQQQGLSRGHFMAVLAGVGMSAAGVATVLASLEYRASAPVLQPAGVPGPVERQNQTLHANHVAGQGAATNVDPAGPPAVGASAGVTQAHMEHLNTLMDDYADQAVVEDPLFAQPIVGKLAIAERKLAEMVSMRGVTIDFVHRFVHGDQLVAEWLLRGTHAGPFMGFPATGRQIELRGMTVVTRENGKIVRESLFYDLATLREQLK